ncbi:MAG: heavy metal sensor histidine kinase [Rubrivivax sp.]|nr:heavy metal sensor histidine kinase [Rubrivivax sp.]
MSCRARSIAARLTLGLGLIALLVFTAAGALLQGAFERDLVAADEATLSGKIRVVLHFIDEATRSGDASGLRHHLDDLRIGHEGLHVWLVSATGQPIYGDQALSAVASAQVQEVILPTSSLWPSGVLRVAQDTGPRDDLLGRHLMTLVAVCATGVAAMVALSWLAIRRCLRVVSRLSGEAASITPRSLGMRLTVPAEGVELNGLVRAFNDVLDRLEEAYAQMKAFNANVAHELRTPLASLATGAQVALASPRSNEELREALISNLEELELLNSLVSDMLFLSRADQGDRAEGLEKVELGSEADKAIRYCEAMLHESDLVADRVGEAPALCNGPLIRRAIVNLLTNAIRHTQAKGRLRLCIDASTESVRLWVGNPGEPLAHHVRAQMFDRFYRGDASRSRHQPGHGLGLAIVAAIARMHGGTVFVVHADGENRVGFTLPTLVADASSDGPPPA